MDRAIISFLRRLPAGVLAVAAFGLTLSQGEVLAQSPDLSADQLEMINQLPAEQRQQALDALRSGQVVSEGGNLQRVTESATSSGNASPEDPARSGQFGPTRRASAGSRVVITFEPRQGLSDDELLSLTDDPVLSRLRGDQVFVLDDAGVLSIPGLESIPLLGLSETEIERRLAASGDLSRLSVDARILDLQPTGIEALEPFGYSIFAPDESGFDPPTTGPVPADYILGPGDTVRIQFFGNTNAVYEFDVTRDGTLNIPDIGPVNVAGISFSDFRRDVGNRVAEMLIGTQVSVAMGQLRTIRVFVLGDVNRPGSHIVSGLATISSALYRGGGVSEVGSLRNIQLKRSGRTVVTLDIYDLLLSGDTSNDLRLQPGDVIFVPPVGATISVGGAVKRPAIYETTDGASLQDAVALAGGLTPEAYARGARLERIEAGVERRVLSVDLDSSSAAETSIAAGDILTVPEVLSILEDTVTLSGHVQRPGPYQWRPGMRLSSLIRSTDELLEGVDTSYVVIRRQVEPAATVEVMSADLLDALSRPGSADDPELMSRDQVFVFSIAYGRQRIIGPLLDDLARQATRDKPFKRVAIAGSVRAPGVYPFERGMRVSDLIRAGGGLAEMAFTRVADLTRYAIVDGQERATELVSVDLESVLNGDESSDVELREHDHLRISSVSNWQTEWAVRIDGEVQFPGVYRIRRGETLRGLLERAGGITEEAFPEGAVFLRESLRQQESEQLQLLAQRIEADLTSLALEADEYADPETDATKEILLEQLRNTEAVGRLVINPAILDPDGGDWAGDDIELMDGDTLLVPVRSPVVTVIGEVQQRTSHVFGPGLTRDDYIEMSGGITRRADKAMIYVVRASGAVIAGSRSRWFARDERVEIYPGDTIVVPMEVDRIRPLTLWAGVTQILYQAAIAVAAVNSF